MSAGDVERERSGWEPVFVNTTVCETATAETLRSALVEIVGERGADGATLEAVLERAGVDRAEFDGEYDSFEECFVSAGCPAPKGFPGATFKFARTTFSFQGGKSLDYTLTRNCEARG